MAQCKGEFAVVNKVMDIRFAQNVRKFLTEEIAASQGEICSMGLVTLISVDLRRVSFSSMFWYRKLVRIFLLSYSCHMSFPPSRFIYLKDI